MENFHWKEYWNLLQGSLQRTYSNLSPEDLAYQEGEEEELMSRLQYKLGKSKKQLNEILFLHLIQGEEEEEEDETLEIQRIIDQIEMDMTKGPSISNQNSIWSW
jgi:hypothetical protein